ncbi:hypothetical protein HUE87_02280 [Candidatus Sulfurimonas marisnigri]|uniref:Periplasmic protein n=1 Tax=Candidatus Sulfurimonas marisnigri TaxID=2740405 RepID=A0A7S7M134_9BACT|nr:hypothetical protein [Candidatus Sulfurimonas marisnigri]QOY55089.1 hypothetical protein HUE87_02280 [Candidatus Sulfurimonas marisnigri]
MIRFLIAGILLFNTLIANAINVEDHNISAGHENSNTTYDSENQLSKEELLKLPKVIYLSYDKIPTRVLKGEIFTVTIKALSTYRDFTDIIYELTNLTGLKLLNEYPSREIDSKYYYDTFYFLTTENHAKLPNFRATLLSYSNKQFKKTILSGKKLNVVALNPKKDFSNILANSFELLDYKTTSYDHNHNIIVFAATATNCDITSFKLKNIFKQGIESVIDSYFDSKITYYAVIDKNIENFSFSYFNLKKNKFIPVNIPIIVNDDSVTTQSDLKPKDQSRERLKMSIAAAIAAIGFLIILWRKKYIYLTLVIIPLAYIVYIGLPSKDVCIKEGSDIHLLPVSNGTIFETTSSMYYLQKEGSTKGFTKVKLKNEKIGWVKNEDICSY